MEKKNYVLLLLIALFITAGCSHHETYSDQKKRERNTIMKYVNDSSINVITEHQFESQGFTTDVSKNEFVLFPATGVYMQIQNQGCGEKIKDGETVTVLCRFTEVNMMTDSIQLSNNILEYASYPDKMTVMDNSGTYTATFIQGESIMARVYGSTSVPSGWLVPLPYINIGRPTNPGDELAKVKLIVPHSQGQAYATNGVYPCLYTITYERGR